MNSITDIFNSIVQELSPSKHMLWAEFRQWEILMQTLFANQAYYHTARGKKEQRFFEQIAFQAETAGHSALTTLNQVRKQTPTKQKRYL